MNYARYGSSAIDNCESCYWILYVMEVCRGGPTLVASRDFLFVIGGQGPNRNNVAEIEQFDPEKNEWRVVSELKRFFFLFLYSC